jgi:hemin uptake protein HemP
MFDSVSQVRELHAGETRQTADFGPQPKRIAVSDLMAGGREAVLLHDGDEYRLRLTSNGKLILTK